MSIKKKKEKKKEKAKELDSGACGKSVPSVWKLNILGYKKKLVQKKQRTNSFILIHSWHQL